MFALQELYLTAKIAYLDLLRKKDSFSIV